MKNEISIKKSMSAGEAAGLLDDLVKSFKEGKVCIESGKKFIILKPAGDITVEIESEVKKDREKLSIEMSWRQAAHEKEGGALLKISSIEPVVEPSAEEDDDKDNNKDDQDDE